VVNLSVIGGIETCISSIDWSEEREQMYAPKKPGPFAVQQFLELLDIASQAIDIGDELDLVSQRLTVGMKATGISLHSTTTIEIFFYEAMKRNTLLESTA
jgi:hypothetical protein